jgi:hypothetical protein
MKIVKGLAILSFFTVLFGSCFDPPEFPNEPQIGFEKIEFYDSEATDSLVIYFNFQDGDGDLGLSGSDLNMISDPYHPLFFYQTTAGGNYQTLTTQAAASSSGDTLDILNIPNPGAGKLVFLRTRKNPDYDTLPAFSCVNYDRLVGRKLLIEAADTIAFDKYTKYVDTLQSLTTTYYRIQDTLYVQPNPNYYNIEVDFFKKVGDDFVEYDWRKQTCLSFDGRFPILSDRNNDLEGTLRYSMNSLGFKSIFGAQSILKLRIQIKDRGLHKSNVIETPEFTLDAIRK